MGHHSKPHRQREAEPALKSADDADLRRQVEERAYQRYCDRGCAPGGEVEDWLTAEREILEVRSRTTPAGNVS